MVTLPQDDLLRGAYSTEEMDRIFSAENQVQMMLRFEWALAAALHSAGLAPSATADTLASLLPTPFLTQERAQIIRRAAAASGNVAIPLLKLLADEAKQRNQAARYVHFGATSQDVLDTALVLQMRDAFGAIARELHALTHRCATMAKEQAQTISVGRTWLQQGPPVTLGLKFAGYAAAFARHSERLEQTRDRCVKLQFGGAVGTLASLGENGLRVSALLAEKLSLPEPSLPWHSHRDRIAETGATLALMAGTAAKIAQDIALSMQTEVGELSEPSGVGRGGSSTMPHKQNPVGCAAVLACAHRIPHLAASLLAGLPQQYERGLGGWQAEWTVLPELFRLTAAVLEQLKIMLDGLQVNTPRMLENLRRGLGVNLSEAVSTALGKAIGTAAAHQLVQAAAQKAIAGNEPLFEVLCGMDGVTEHLTSEDLARLLRPENYLGSTHELIKRTLAELGI